MTERTLLNLKIKVLQADQPAYEIAVKCGMSPSQLSQYVTGRQRVRPKHLRALARFFKCSQQEILGTSTFEIGGV
jgi:transcriptional regulator with XRE-family HTH domain